MTAASIQEQAEELTADRCPVCKSTEVSFDPGVCDWGECGSCGHDGEAFTFWVTAEELGLSPDSCEACGRRRSWGCGHTYAQEVAFRLHRQTADHLLGDCDCYVSVPGYLARFTRDQRRERVAAVLKLIDTAQGGASDFANMLDRVLYGDTAPDA